MSRPPTQKLRKFSPNSIGKAADETAAQVTRIGLTFLGATVFCLLSLLSPDSALLGGSEKINVPLAGPVSFIGFMLVGPAILIMLRVYLQIYVEHSDRLDRVVRSMSVVQSPTLVPLQNPLMRWFSAFIFYALLPLTMMAFVWKAAVFPAWGSGLRGLGVVSGGLLAVAAGVVASHVMLPLKTFFWRSKVLLSIGAVVVVAGMMAGFVKVGFEPVRRPFELYHANLSGQWLLGDDLKGANLGFANLSGANLSLTYLDGADLPGANLSGADLTGAELPGANLSGVVNLSGANLSLTNLSGANLPGGNLSGANLSLANLSGANLPRGNLSGANLSLANLSGADLSGAENLTQKQLDSACGNASTNCLRVLN